MILHVDQSGGISPVSRYILQCFAQLCKSFPKCCSMPSYWYKMAFSLKRYTADFRKLTHCMLLTCLIFVAAPSHSQQQSHCSSWQQLCIDDILCAMLLTCSLLLLCQTSNSRVTALHPNNSVLRMCHVIQVLVSTCRWQQKHPYQRLPSCTAPTPSAAP